MTSVAREGRLVGDPTPDDWSQGSAMSDSPSVQCHGVTKTFGAKCAVKDLSLDLGSGEILALVGPSGCGKTTLLRLIAGFEAPDSGTLTLEGRPVAGAGVWVPPEARRLGMVFQDYTLFPHMTVMRNITFGLDGWAKDSRDARAWEMLEMVNLTHLAERYPYELSGGEQQRVALVRSLAPGPVAVLLDEPFSNLDPNLRHQLRSEVKEIFHSSGVTALYVTHDQEEAFLMGDKVAVMNAGCLEQVSTPEDIFRHPGNPFVAQFLIRADLIPATATKEGLMTPAGMLRPPVPVASGTEFEVSCRPDVVSMRASETGQATVVDREFQGMHCLYTLSLPSGVVLRSLQHYTSKYRVGDRADVYFEPNRTLVCFMTSNSHADPDVATPLLAVAC